MMMENSFSHQSCQLKARVAVGVTAHALGGFVPQVRCSQLEKEGSGSLATRPACP